MKIFLAFFAMIAVGWGAPPEPKPPRFFLADASHPVVYGEAWLIENGWGDYPALRVGWIHDGKLELDVGVTYPECSDWGDGCKLALGVSEKTLPAPASKEIESAYGAKGAELSQRFPLLYLSGRIEDVEQTDDWLPALHSLGHADPAGLVLPRPEKRTVRLLYPDGRPYGKAHVRVALFGANNNHCGAALGLPLGEFTSDAQGRIAVTAVHAPLAVSVAHFEEQREGPAGTAYAARTELVTGPEADITLQRVWTLAEREYTVTVRQAGGSPLAGVGLSGCAWNPPCAAACGPVPGAGVTTDRAGVARFRDQDLRRLRNLTLTDAAGRTMYLSLAELRELLSSGRVSVEWREPPRPPQGALREP